MRKYLLTISIIFTVIFAKAQDDIFKPPSDTSLAFCLIGESNVIGEKFSEYNIYGTTYLKRDLIVPVVAALNGVNDYKSFEIAYRGKSFFVDAEKVKVNSKTFNLLASMNEDSKSAYRQMAVDAGIEIHVEEMVEMTEWFKKTSPSGIAIYKRQVYDESEYTDGTGIEFQIHNTSKKTIKYITFNFTGYNAVDDPVSTMKTRKGIGPIEPENAGGYTFEYVWHTDIVEYAKLNSIKIQYTDNTFKTLTSNTLSKLFVPDVYKEYLLD
ncbi:hypothetical protein HCX49_21945 [Sphingobacterium kitahiroshimense]|uniref:hypothetical protein n=1 Tax=Sphingobacterium sp. B16(2022) TaxID=2914044 RepID=UPI00143C6A71|nr:hypothetical protein [Sphingobacterium sp. B16(2022)]NJI75864.1 hypothetical protein [Sphingobacterium sp. B16(2022)]